MAGIAPEKLLNPYHAESNYALQSPMKSAPAMKHTKAERTRVIFAFDSTRALCWLPCQALDVLTIKEFPSITRNPFCKGASLHNPWFHKHLRFPLKFYYCAPGKGYRADTAYFAKCSRSNQNPSTPCIIWSVIIKSKSSGWLWKWLSASRLLICIVTLYPISIQQSLTHFDQ